VKAGSRVHRRRREATPATFQAAGIAPRGTFSPALQDGPCWSGKSLNLKVLGTGIQLFLIGRSDTTASRDLGTVQLEWIQIALHQPGGYQKTAIMRDWEGNLDPEYGFELGKRFALFHGSWVGDHRHDSPMVGGWKPFSRA